MEHRLTFEALEGTILGSSCVNPDPVLFLDKIPGLGMEIQAREDQEQE